MTPASRRLRPRRPHRPPSPSPAPEEPPDRARAAGRSKSCWTSPARRPTARRSGTGAAGRTRPWSSRWLWSLGGGLPGFGGGRRRLPVRWQPAQHGSRIGMGSGFAMTPRQPGKRRAVRPAITGESPTARRDRLNAAPPLESVIGPVEVIVSPSAETTIWPTTSWPPVSVFNVNRLSDRAGLVARGVRQRQLHRLGRGRYR